MSAAHTILIVDDSATTRALIKRAISLAGLPVAQTYEAANGQEALELLGCIKVDLVLADLNMPEMNGFEMTRQMWRDPSLRGTPVVLVSAEPNAADFASSHEGIRGLVRKPFSPEALLSILSPILGVVHA